MHLITLSSLMTLLLLSCGNDRPKSSTPPPPPPPEPAQQRRDTPPVAFDGKRAFEYLKTQVDFGPRTPGSRSHQECLAYLSGELRNWADAVNLQPFTQKGYGGETLQLTNVIASFHLKATTRILLLAHWDSRPRAEEDHDPKKRTQPVPGANDGASGVAVLLELGRMFHEKPPGVGVDLLLTDGEDYGKQGDNAAYLLGARYFAQHLPPGFRPAFGILLDMVGDRQLELQKERSSLTNAPDVVQLVWSTARELGVEQFTDELQGPVLDDHVPLNEAGIKTIDLIDFNYPDETNRYWHTTEDTPDKCSPQSLQAVGSVLAAVVYRYTP
jgi:glutaminyl-peptide cyclotransferase